MATTLYLIRHSEVCSKNFINPIKNDIDFQEYVDDFFLSYEVQRNKCLRNITKYLSDVANDLDSEKERLKKQTKQQIKSDYWWARCDNFSHLVDDMSLQLYIQFDQQLFLA